MIVDLTHSSDKVVEDVLEIATKPFIISHTGLQGFCNTSRTISDELALKVANKGGVLGIGYWYALEDVPLLYDSMPMRAIEMVLMGVRK